MLIINIISSSTVLEGSWPLHTRVVSYLFRHLVEILGRVISSITSTHNYECAHRVKTKLTCHEKKVTK